METEGSIADGSDTRVTDRAFATRNQACGHPQAPQASQGGAVLHGISTVAVAIQSVARVDQTWSTGGIKVVAVCAAGPAITVGVLTAAIRAVTVLVYAIAVEIQSARRR